MSDFTLNVPVKSSASMSSCGRYRWWLTRVWDDRKPVHCWIMLNPSTADEEKDDPTVRRAMGFSHAWDGGGVCIVNLFALRSIVPSTLRADPAKAIGELNDRTILTAVEGRKIIAAWGEHGGLLNRDRDVMNLIMPRKIECLGTTNGGHPRHPLYVSNDTPLKAYEMRSR